MPQHEAEPGEGVRRRFVLRQGFRGDAAHDGGADGLRLAVEMEQHGNGLVYVVDSPIVVVVGIGDGKDAGLVMDDTKSIGVGMGGWG